MTVELGRGLIDALVAGDFDAARDRLHPELYLRGLTPGSFQVAEGDGARDQALEIFRDWFYEDDDDLTAIEWCEVAPCGRGGRYKLTYGLRAKSPGMADWYRDKNLRSIEADAEWIVEQEAYYETKDGKICWMIVLCGGYHPADEVVAADRASTSASPYQT